MKSGSLGGIRIAFLWLGIAITYAYRGKILYKAADDFNYHNSLGHGDLKNGSSLSTEYKN